MAGSELIQIREGYAYFCPEGRVTWRLLLVQLEGVAAECRENGVTRVMMCTTKLMHDPISIADRYFMIEGLSKFWDRSVKLCMVGRPDQVDPERFGVMVARNRGLILGVSTSEKEGLEWLLND